jgi:mycothiol synthase
MTEKTLLDPSLKLRPATWADVNPVAELIYAVCEADGDATIATSPEDLEHSWHEDGFTLEADAFVVETQSGRLVGYVELFNEKAHADLNADAYNHPDFEGLGVREALFARIEERAHEMMRLAEPDLRVFIHTTTDSRDQTGQDFFARIGYTLVRYFWRMEIKLDAPPPVFALPDGIELRPFDKEAHARLMWQADNEAFSEHWGSHDSTFEEWTFRKFERPEFDPSLWLVAWDGDQIAGYSQNRFRMGIGWVGTLGVRKPWRKMGLGLALLHASFADFYQRGTTTIGLGVDASNKTGATRLYQRAGMRVATEFVTFEKELRPGKALDDADQRM